MASHRKYLNNYGFYITLSDFYLPILDKKNTVFGQVTEGFDTIERISETAVDSNCRPLKDIYIKDTTILEDPFPDMPGLFKCNLSESKESNFLSNHLIENSKNTAKSSWPGYIMESEIQRKESNNKAAVLEMLGDLPNANIKPRKDVLFVCKLNPLTNEDALELIFSQYGVVLSCDIIRDPKTGESLNYGFVGFKHEISCERAYFKMNNTIVDGRRIKVDFSQSVAYLWKHHQKSRSK